MIRKELIDGGQPGIHIYHLLPEPCIPSVNMNYVRSNLAHVKCVDKMFRTASAMRLIPKNNTNARHSPSNGDSATLSKRA
jgi:hypothetical protein